MEKKKKVCTHPIWNFFLVLLIFVVAYEIDFFKSDQNGVRGCCDDPNIQIYSLKVEFDENAVADVWE